MNCSGRNSSQGTGVHCISGPHLKIMENDEDKIAHEICKRLLMATLTITRYTFPDYRGQKLAVIFEHEQIVDALTMLERWRKNNRPNCERLR